MALLAKATSKVRGSQEKLSMTVLHRIAALILTLLTIDSATTTGIFIYQFSGVLVSAIVEIQIEKGVQVHQNDPHEFIPHVRHSAWHNLVLQHGVQQVILILPRLHLFV